MKVLIAEDDDSVAGALIQVLAGAGHDTERVSSGSSLLLQHRGCDVVLLDLGLTDGDAFDSLRRLRQVSDVPVLVVTARSDERSTVRALHLGADDYLVKPIRLHELMARIDAVTRRRAVGAPTPDAVEVAGLTIDLGARTVRNGARDIVLTTKEFDLLSVLARRAGTAVSRQQILDEVWGDAFAAASRSFDVHLTQIRSKLPKPSMITTIRGFGYRLET